MKLNKNRGQVQLGETTAVVIVVIILLFIGIVFWNRVNSQDIQSLSDETQELSVIEIANVVSELPELKCYDSSVNRLKCLDWHKILAMDETLKTNRTAYDFYNNHFKSSKITIMQTYPENINVTIYDARLSNQTVTKHIEIPINIKNYATRKTGYGLIIVEGYYRA